MSSFALFATPWWVNLCILIPIATYFLFKKCNVLIGRERLLITAIFGTAFGFVEAAVVIYLRAAVGLLPGDQVQIVNALATNLVIFEMVREAVTIVMLIAVALLAEKKTGERIGVFLWTFAFWDIFYYVWLRVAIGWPVSLTTPDVLFLLPVPWLAQVWFPLLVSGLTILVIGFRSRGG